MVKFKVGNSVKARINTSNVNGGFLLIKGKVRELTSDGGLIVLGLSNVNSKDIKEYRLGVQDVKNVSSTRLEKGLSLKLDESIKLKGVNKLVSKEVVEKYITSNNLRNIKLSDREMLGVFFEYRTIDICLYKDGKRGEDFIGTESSYEYDGSRTIYSSKDEFVVKSNWGKVSKVSLNKLEELGLKSIGYKVYFRGEDTQCLRVTYSIGGVDELYNLENILKVIIYLKNMYN